MKNAIDMAKMSKADQSRADILPAIAIGSPNELSCKFILEFQYSIKFMVIVHV